MFIYSSGGDEIGNIDGINSWDYLAGFETKSPRNGVLLNIDEKKKSAAVISGNWKLVRLGEF